MRILVTGAAGQLGRDLLDVLHGQVPAGGIADAPWGPRDAGSAGGAIEVVGTDLPELDLTDRDALGSLVESVRPEVIVHGAAWTAVDACEGDPDRAMASNTLATRHVVEAADRLGAHVVYVSTDYVFDGTSARPYVEWDTPNPQSVYGRTKWGGEQELGRGHTVVRTSWVCGAHGANMVKTVLRLAGESAPLRFVDDQHGSPTFTADLAGAIGRLAVERRPGRFHVTNSGVTTWFGFARAVLAAVGDDPDRVVPVRTADLVPPRPAARPQNSVLDNAAWRLSGLPTLPDWHDALGRLIDALGDGVPGGHGVPSPTPVSGA